MAKKVIKLYKVEVGVLLDETHPDYESYAYVYDKKHAYYDENVAFFTNKRNAIRYLNHYVADGVVNTYGVLSELDYIPEEIYGDGWKELAEYDLKGVKENGYLEDYIGIFESDSYDLAFVTMNKYKVADKKYATIF